MMRVEVPISNELERKLDDFRLKVQPHTKRPISIWQAILLVLSHSDLVADAIVYANQCAPKRISR